MENNNPSILQTVRALVDDLGTLVGKELDLAKAEAVEKIEQVQTGIVAILFGMLVGFCALLVLVQAVVVALSNVMPPALAASAVGIVLAIIAFVAIRSGETHLKPKNLAPRRTMRSVSAQTNKIREQIQ
jgi:uncharacterized membrane protein YqjE